METERSCGKTPLLFLCHRIPYPPNKGDKIRSFHLLHHLSRTFDVFLAAFVDDSADLPFIPDVEKYCRDSLHLGLKPWKAKVRSLRGMLTGEALSIPYYANRSMQKWVKDVVARHKIEHVIVYSSAMAQFVPVGDFTFRRKVIDFVDVDSDKWQQYAQQKSWPMSWLYQREARQLLKLERKLARQFDAGLFVSSAEADMFRNLCPEFADKIGHYNNGVNAEYFDPGLEYSNPYPEGSTALVFTGAMDYWPNEDAVEWFCRRVLPGLQKTSPQMKFYIVGGNPSKKVRQLAENTAVVVTGRVEDIRPWIYHAAAAVAPMRVARGIQNKVLEAMAMERPIVVSSKGLEGIDAIHGEHLLLADSPSDYLEMVRNVISGKYADVGKKARMHVTRHFNWDENLPEVVLLLEHGSARSSDGIS